MEKTLALEKALLNRDSVPLYIESTINETLNNGQTINYIGNVINSKWKFWNAVYMTLQGKELWNSDNDIKNDVKEKVKELLYGEN